MMMVLIAVIATAIVMLFIIEGYAASGISRLDLVSHYLFAGHEFTSSKVEQDSPTTMLDLPTPAFTESGFDKLDHHRQHQVHGIRRPGLQTFADLGNLTKYKAPTHDGYASMLISRQILASRSLTESKFSTAAPRWLSPARSLRAATSPNTECPLMTATHR